MFLLLDGQDANGSGAEADWNIGREYNAGVVQAFGVFDTATVTLEYSPDLGTTWFTVGTSTTFTAIGNGQFYLPGKFILRGTVTSVGASTDVSLGLL